MANIALPEGKEPLINDFVNTAPDGCSFPSQRFTPATSAYPTPTAAVIVVHGFIEHHGRYVHVGKYFASQGISTLTWSQRGFGKREKKEYGDTSWPQQYQDIEHVVKQERKYLDETFGKDKIPLYLYGHSMGGGLTFGFFTRPESDSVPSAEAKSAIKGAICSGPWLRLAAPPPGVAVWLAPRLHKLFPRMPWYAPVNPAELSRDPAVVADNKADKLCSGSVYLRAVLGPLLGGPRLVSEDYARWPKNLPILFTHGDKDPVCDPKASVELNEKLVADDKEAKLWPGYLHEGHNEPGDDKVKFLQYSADWINKRAQSVSVSAPSAPAAAAVADTPTNSRATNGAWATLMTGEKYLPGLAVFSESLLRTHGSKYPLVVMATPGLSARARQAVEELGCQLIEVADLRPKMASQDLAFARFGDVWTKLRAFELAQFDRVVMVDSDMLVRRNMDELFDLPLGQGSNAEIASGFACTCNPNKIASYPSDWTPDNCAFSPQQHPEALTSPTPITIDSRPTYQLLNSGLVVLTPSLATMRAMEERLDTDPQVPKMSFPDQDFLAAFYRGKWQPLPWYYNALKKLRSVHPAMWRDEEVRNVHYILNKPWNYTLEADDPDAQLHQWWWDAWHKLEISKAGMQEDLWQQTIAVHVNEAPRPANVANEYVQAAASHL